MQRRSRLNQLAAVSAAVVGSGVLCGTAMAQTADSEKVFGLTGATAPQALISFQSTNPGTITALGTVAVPTGELVVGIDTQPATGRLFAVTRDASGNGRVYTVNKATGATTLVTSTPFALAGTATTTYGVDFNPVPNAIRIVSSDELNIRVSPATGNLLGADTALAPAGNVVSVAYTNATGGAQQATLYDIDSAADTLLRQGGLGGVPSPNLGALTTLGPLGFDVADPVGFDISGATGAPYVSVQVGGASFFSTINLGSGAVPSGALIGDGTGNVRDIAIDTQAPSVQFSAAAYSASEKAGKATVTITRSGNTDAASTVSYATSATGNATAGTDYTAIAATPVTFAAGETTKTFDITIANDTAVEDAETIGVALSANTGAALGAPNVATVTVFDDDPATTTTTTTVPGPTVTLPGTVRTVAPVPVAIASGTAKASPTRDKKAPYSFKISGSVTPPSGLDKTTACRYGTVRMTVKPSSGKSVAYEKLITTKCTFSATLPVAKKGKYTVTVKFLGSDRLSSKTLKTLKVQAG